MVMDSMNLRLSKQIWDKILQHRGQKSVEDFVRDAIKKYIVDIERGGRRN